MEVRYATVTGSWLSNDPIGIRGGLNQYVFVGNNPVMFVDSDGMDYRYIYSNYLSLPVGHLYLQIRFVDGFVVAYDMGADDWKWNPGNICRLLAGGRVSGSVYVDYQKFDKPQWGYWRNDWVKTTDCQDKALDAKCQSLLGTGTIGYNVYVGNSAQWPVSIVNSVLHPTTSGDQWHDVFVFPNWTP